MSISDDPHTPSGPEPSVAASELGSWKLWRQLQMMRAAAEASASCQLGDEEIEAEWSVFCRSHQVEPATGKPVPTAFSGCKPGELKQALVRDLRIARWKKDTFGPHAKSHFATRKAALDRVVYSLIRVSDAGLARELWFRLRENEATFAELAARYTSGHEVHTSGVLGPAAFGSMHPALAAHLRTGEEGKLLKPVAIGETAVVARVEKFLPAHYDEAMEARMTEELCSLWLNKNIDESRG
jgi:parvulin-like peptidyl-prolyl isomerase